MTKGGVLVDVCKTCKGVWLDRGEVFFFSRKPRELERVAGARRRHAECRRVASVRGADMDLEEVPFLRPDLLVDRCPECEGYWFDAGELAQGDGGRSPRLPARDRGLSASGRFDDPLADAGLDPLEPAHDERAHHRIRTCPRGCSRCPTSSSARPACSFLLYGILGLILITLAELDVISAGVAVAIGVGIIILQFVFGPWLMDLSLRWIYKFSWVHDRPVARAPPRLRRRGWPAEQNMKVPWFGLIHDGAPNAFTYGHHPNNMRIVITQGILDLLEPEEVEGVVAHEIGHGKNWDMLLMTVVQLVPLLLYFALPDGPAGRRPRQGQRLPDRGGGRGVCPLHRQRVHRALVQPLPRVLRRPLRRQGDRQPQRAGLGPGQDRLRPGGARPVAGAAEEEADAEDKKGKKKKKKSRAPALDAIGAMGIFDRKSAVAMVASSAAVGFDRSGSGTARRRLRPPSARRTSRARCSGTCGTPGRRSTS